MNLATIITSPVMILNNVVINIVTYSSEKKYTSWGKNNNIGDELRPPNRGVFDHPHFDSFNAYTKDY